MRIEGPGRTAQSHGAQSHGAPARPSGGGFFLSAPDSSVASRPAAAMVAPSSLDQLIALQMVPDGAERRRRAIGRGRGLLGALEELRLGLLSGDLSEAALGRLRALIAESREFTGDAGLDDLLAAVELRAEVELAKRRAWSQAGGEARAQDRRR